MATSAKLGSVPALRRELARAQARLSELEATLLAIRRGDVDAVLIDGPQGPRVFTLQSPEEPYRILVERMNEGAATMTTEGTVLFCNRRLSEMVGLPAERILGSWFGLLLAPSERSSCSELLERASRSQVRAQATLATQAGPLVPVVLSLSAIPLEEPHQGVCMVATDVSEQKRAEEEVRRLNADLEHRVSLRTQQLETAAAKLQESLSEKEVLLHEVHHRVKNNLAVICSLFSLESRYASDEQTAKVFRESGNRVHSMALVHESLYGSQKLGRIDLAEYARTLTGDVLSSYGQDQSEDARIRLSMDVHSVTIPLDSAVPFGLILNELISNTVQHAFPAGEKGEIRLMLRRANGGPCVLTLSDNGVGIPAGLDVATTHSLGLRLVRSLTRQLHGEFQLRRTEPGTSAQLQFPVVSAD